jgi:hypothetical protein
MTPEQIADDKRQIRERRTAEQKAAYTAAQGAQTDIESYIADADDGSAGLEDLLGLVPTRKHAAWRVK